MGCLPRRSLTRPETMWLARAAGVGCAGQHGLAGGGRGTAWPGPREVSQACLSLPGAGGVGHPGGLQWPTGRPVETAHQRVLRCLA